MQQTSDARHARAGIDDVSRRAPPRRARSLRVARATRPHLRTLARARRRPHHGSRPALRLSGRRQGPVGGPRAQERCRRRRARRRGWRRACWRPVAHSRKCRRAWPQHRSRVLVQPMITGLGEVLIGYRVDPDVGPLIMVAMGGIFTEIYRDRSLRLAPVDLATAHEMIAEVRGLMRRSRASAASRRAISMRSRTRSWRCLGWPMTRAVARGRDQSADRARGRRRRGGGRCGGEAGSLTALVAP